MPNLPILVIGGGPAGLEAARGIADLGYNAILVDKAEFFGWYTHFLQIMQPSRQTCGIRKKP
jgi:Heterodisulfide reductase, subunit A and related polyferredoxins